MLRSMFMNERPLTRRALLKAGAATAGTMSLGALLAACGDDGNGGAGSASSPTRPSSLTPVSTRAASPGRSASPSRAASPSGSASPTGGAVVEMTDDLVFDPEDLTIRVGDTVTWRTTGTMPHTSTCDPAKATNPADAQLPDGAEPWDSGIVTQGKEWSRTFDTPGDYVYFCIPHEAMGMVARITVEEA